MIYKNKDAYPKNYKLNLINDLPARFIFLSSL